MDSDELIVGVVEEFNLVGHVHADRVSDKSFTAFNVPDDQLVIILPTERSHVLLIGREREILNQNLVQFESVEHGHGIEIPDNDIGLESHVGLLSRGDVLAGSRDSDHGNVIIVSSEELLGSSEGVSDYEGGAQREDNVLIIGVKDESTVNLALESDDSG